MLAQGTLVGGFRVREPLGAGAMGTVYLADTVESDAPVAVKIIATGPSNDRRFRERFERRFPVEDLAQIGALDILHREIEMAVGLT